MSIIADQCDNILRLNDDCFYHIFNYLPVRDWCSLRGTCTRLRTISDYCFQRQTETFQLMPVAVTGSCYDLLSLIDVKRLIITKLTINRKKFEDSEDPRKLLPFLDRYCLELRDLKFVDVDLDAQAINHCERLFSNLHRLVIDQWNDEATLGRYLDECVSLKELELIRLANIGNSLIRQRFECLESFTLSCCSDVDYKFVRQFLIQNSQLKKVKLLGSAFQIPGNIMNDLAMALPDLLELSLKGSDGFYQPNISKMHSLKKFEMDCILITDEIMAELLTGLAGLKKFEHLHLASFNLTDQSIERLCTLKNLTTLALTTTNHLYGKICKKLAIELPALSEVQIIQCEHTIFNGINEFVVHLANLKRIVFVRYDRDNNDDDEEPRPSITADLFLSLVGIRNSKPNKEILLIFLYDLNEVHSQLKWSEKWNILEEHSNVVKLLPLDEEQRRTLYEYGITFSGRRHLYDDVVSSNDDDDDDDNFHDAFGDDQYNSLSDDSDGLFGGNF